MSVNRKPPALYERRGFLVIKKGVRYFLKKYLTPKNFPIKYTYPTPPRVGCLYLP